MYMARKFLTCRISRSSVRFRALYLRSSANRVRGPRASWQANSRRQASSQAGRQQAGSTEAARQLAKLGEMN